MSDLPLKTRVYTLLLVLITAVSTAIAWRAEYQVFLANLPNLLFIAGILLVMIVVSEVLDVSFPQAGEAFNVSVSAAFCFAAGLTIGPFLGGIVVALAHTFDARPDWTAVSVDLGVCAVVGVASLAVATWAYRRAAVR